MPPLISLYQHFLNHPVICTDTRSITKDCLFFALKGEHFDANTFACNALELGAAYAVIDNPVYRTDERCILVEDVLTTLQELARHHRAQLDIPVIGLTGSNGKTTTKELIRAVLSTQFSIYATKGNLNNHIGVPLSILSITPDTEMAVIEMGANHQQEIAFLCTIARPTHGLITNIGMAHLDGFGGFEGVKKGKAELFTALAQSGGTAFINLDNEVIMEMSRKAGLQHTIYYGTAAAALSGQLLRTDPVLEISWQNGSGPQQVSTQLTGSYNFENILAAICIGSYFKLSPEQINTGISTYSPNNNRSQLTKTADNTVICDFYNANPSSMTAALENLFSMEATHKAAILGDMYELGPETETQHRAIAMLASRYRPDKLVFIGKNFYALKDQVEGEFFLTPAEARVWLTTQPLTGSLILLKGSRGIALEQLLPAL